MASRPNRSSVRGSSGHREMVEVEREGGVELGNVQDQTMTSANETWCARLTQKKFLKGSAIASH